MKTTNTYYNHLRTDENGKETWLKVIFDENCNVVESEIFEMWKIEESEEEE